MPASARTCLGKGGRAGQLTQQFETRRSDAGLLTMPLRSTWRALDEHLHHTVSVFQKAEGADVVRVTNAIIFETTNSNSARVVHFPTPLCFDNDRSRAFFLVVPCIAVTQPV